MGKWTEAQRAKFSATMKKKFGKKYRSVTKEVKPLIKKTKTRRMMMTVYYNEDGNMQLGMHGIKNYNEAAHILYSEYAMHYIHEVRIV